MSQKSSRKHNQSNIKCITQWKVGDLVLCDMPKSIKQIKGEIIQIKDPEEQRKSQLKQYEVQFNIYLTQNCFKKLDKNKNMNIHQSEVQKMPRISQELLLNKKQPYVLVEQSNQQKIKHLIVLQRNSNQHANINKKQKVNNKGRRINQYTSKDIQIKIPCLQSKRKKKQKITKKSKKIKQTSQKKQKKNFKNKLIKK